MSDKASPWVALSFLSLSSQWHIFGGGRVDSVMSYLELINKIITLCSPMVPLFAFILRKLKIIRPQPEDRNELVELIAVPAFGVFGGAIGLFTTLGAAILIVFLIGMHFYQLQTSPAWSQSWSGMQLPPLNLNAGALISAGVSIVTTLVIFGGKNKLRGVSFLAGCCLGAAIGVMVIASWVLH